MSKHPPGTAQTPHSPRPAGPDVSAGRSSHATGVLLIVAAAALWSLNGALIKLLNAGGRGPTGVTIAFYRSLIAGVFLVPFAWGRFDTLRRGRTAPDRNRDARGSDLRRPVAIAAWIRPETAFCVVFFAAMTLAFVVANTMTSAANTIILQYTSTFWVFGLSPWILREMPQRRDVGFLVLAMSGIGILFAGNAGGGVGGLIVALTAGLFYGLLTLMIRRMRDCDSAAVTVVNNLGSAALLLIPVWMWGQFSLTPREWLLIAVMGVVQFGVPYYLFALGLSRVPAYKAALLGLVEPVLVPAWTYFAVQETVDPATAIGGGMILLSLILFLRAKQGKRRRREEAGEPHPEGGMRPGSR